MKIVETPFKSEDKDYLKKPLGSYNNKEDVLECLV